jgi:CelD/BcsL family acetyltransferase involved in cellulose biosynthesis
MSALACREIHDPADLHGLAPAWWDLWRGCPPATPFQSPAWLLPWWQAFAPGELCVVAVQAGERLVGLAPFYLETGAQGRRLLPLGMSVSDYLDVLVAPGTAAGEALAEWMAATDIPWESCEWADLAPDAAALRLPGPARCEDVLQASEACPVLPLPADPAAFEHSLSSRKRHHLRTAWNRARRRGEVAPARADAATAGDLFCALRRLHGLRWMRSGEPGVLSDPRVVRFHQAAVPLLLEAGLLRLYALRIAGEIVAVHYGMICRDRAYAYLTGFDPAYAFESPSAILLGHAIAEAIREGAREFHMLRGREAYKYSWGAADRWNRRRIFRRSAPYARAC